jgi:UDP-glucose 4-epimerase
LDSKTVLVTGGAGFIGSHLCERLLLAGYDVSSLDNYFTGTTQNHIDGVEYITGDTKQIAQKIHTPPALVFHLGEYARVEQSFADITQVLDLNVSGTHAVLEYCRKHQTKLVYAGSSTKFADGGIGRDQSPYAWTKASNTELVINYGNWFDLEYAVTYFYNVYGPRECGTGSYATLIALFKEKYLRGEPLTIVSPGTQRRNFTHVDDIVEGLFLVGEKGKGDGYGLGNPTAYSIMEIAQLFNTDITLLPERPGNRMSAALDTSRAEYELNWASTKMIKDYIQQIVLSQQK